MISKQSRPQILEILQVLLKKARENRVEPRKIAHFLDLVPLLLTISEEKREKTQASRTVELALSCFPQYLQAKVQAMQLFHREIAVRRAGLCRDYDFLGDFLNKCTSFIDFYSEFSDFYSDLVIL